MGVNASILVRVCLRACGERRSRSAMGKGGKLTGEQKKNAMDRSPRSIALVR
jgi:hypothetical protein